MSFNYILCETNTVEVVMQESINQEWLSYGSDETKTKIPEKLFSDQAKGFRPSTPIKQAEHLSSSPITCL